MKKIYNLFITQDIKEENRMEIFYFKVEYWIISQFMID